MTHKTLTTLQASLSSLESLLDKPSPAILKPSAQYRFNRLVVDLLQTVVSELIEVSGDVECLTNDPDD